MTRSTKGRLVIFVTVLLIQMLWPAHVTVGQGDGWSTVLQLSDSESQASRVSLVADDYGYVHAFWSEQFVDAPSVIQYACFDGRFWSDPIDIYADIGSGTEIRFPGATLDHKGILHLVWGGSQWGPAYYISSPIQGANSARSWSEPLIIELPVHEPKLHVQADGTLHLVYSSYWGEPPSLAPGVYYVRLDAERGVWTDPLWLDPDIREQDAPQTLELVADRWDGLHALWWYDNRYDSGAHDKPVRYAHSLDGGYTWSAPRTVAVGSDEGNSTRVAGPILTILGEQVHLVWAQGRLPYRVHKISPDRGQTWGPARRILGDLESQAFDALIADSTERLHFLGTLRFPDAVYHATWKSGSWSEPQLVYLQRMGPFDPLNGRIAAHNLDAAIAAGNELVITFTDPPPDEKRGLYTMHRTLGDMESWPILPIPTRMEPSESPTPHWVATEMAASTSPTPPISVHDTAPSTSAMPSANPAMPVAAAGVAALMLVATTILMVRRRR